MRVFLKTLKPFFMRIRGAMVPLVFMKSLRNKISKAAAIKWRSSGDEGNGIKLLLVVKSLRMPETRNFKKMAKIDAYDLDALVLKGDSGSVLS